MDAVWIIFPRSSEPAIGSCRIMRRAVAWSTKKTALRLTSIRRSQSAGVTSSNGLPWMIPALLKRTSRRPQRCQAASSIASMSPGRVTSAGTACWPSSAASFAAAPPSRSAMSTRAPSAANRLAHAAPIPLAPPVINTMRPVNVLFAMPGLWHRCHGGKGRGRTPGRGMAAPARSSWNKTRVRGTVGADDIWYDDGHVAAARGALRGGADDDWIRVGPTDRDRGPSPRTSTAAAAPSAGRPFRDDAPVRRQQLRESAARELRSSLHRAAFDEVRDADEHRPGGLRWMDLTEPARGSRADGTASGSGLVRAGVHHRVGRATTRSAGEAAALTLIE